MFEIWTSHHLSLTAESVPLPKNGTGAPVQCPGRSGTGSVALSKAVAYPLYLMVDTGSGRVGSVLSGLRNSGWDSLSLGFPLGEKGILCLHIRNRRWILGYRSERSRELLLRGRKATV